MKIALINPPFLFPSRNQIVTSQCLGLRSLSATLKKDGHEVVFIDALMLGFDQVNSYASGLRVGLNADEIAKRVPPDCALVGLSVPFSQLAPVCHDIVAELKSRNPAQLIVMGGIYPSTQPKLALTSQADMIIIGEGEIALCALAAGASPAQIQGAYIPGEEGPYESAKKETDLDLLPLVDYEIPLIENYFEISPRMSRYRAAQLITSRGCPYDCEFCSVHPICGRDWRARSAEHVLSEIRMLVSDFAVQSIEIEDDNFTLNHDRSAAILEGIIHLNENGAGLSLRTTNGVRIDTLNKEIINLFKRAGCSELVLALEHGDPQMLKEMNKKLDLDKAYEVTNLCVQAGIPKISIFCIIGYPGETRQRFENALTFYRKLKELGGKRVCFCANMAQAYPGTRLLERCRREGIITDPNVDNFLVRRDLMSTSHLPAIITQDFDASEVLRRKKQILAISEPWQQRLRDNIGDLLPEALQLQLVRIKGTLLDRFT